MTVGLKLKGITLNVSSVKNSFLPRMIPSSSDKIVGSSSLDIYYTRISG
jgi:hypothetical protein